MPWWQGPIYHLSLVLKRRNVSKKHGKKKLQNKGLHGLYFSPDITMSVKTRRMWGHGTCMGQKKKYIKKALNTSREETTWNIQCTEWKIILKRMWCYQMDSKSPVWGLVEDFFQCSNDTCLEAFMATKVNKISGWQLDNVLLNTLHCQPETAERFYWQNIMS